MVEAQIMSVLEPTFISSPFNLSLKSFELLKLGKADALSDVSHPS